MACFEVLRPHLEAGVPLARAARAAGVSQRTARRWLAAYRRDGLVGLARRPRADRGRRRLPSELLLLIEGLALRRPAPSVAAIHRQVAEIARGHGWPVPSYSRVYEIVRGLDPALVTLAQEGSKRFREVFDLVHRRTARRPNAIWQADHTQLDLHVLGPAGEHARPWLTVILDDYSRAVAGYAVFLEAPSALQTALALRQAIWRKPQPAWHICGIPAVFYTDHGSDFTSQHLAQVAADLHMQLVFSTPGMPRGRGKIERVFATIHQLLISTLPGYAPRGTPTSPPQLTLADLDRAVGAFLIEDYHTRVHSETRQPPQAHWEAGGFLPQLPERLEDLDLLLLTVATPRKVHPDGIHFQGLRYLDPILAAYVGEPVTIRYDPRDLAELRVFHHDTFVCRAICPELADRTISLKDLAAARTARRRELSSGLRERASVVDRLVALHQPSWYAPIPPRPAAADPQPSEPAAPKLKRYREE
jgi:putative transposase